MARKNIEIAKPVATNTVQSKYGVHRTFTVNGDIVSEDDETEVIDVHKFITEPAEVGITYGSTVNLGNYEAARIDVWCKVPAYREELDQAYEFVQKFVDQKMTEQMTHLEEFQTEKKSKKNKDNSPF